ncbi:hypothetical protein [Olivibacter sitiensis]|uniref:hypothetical protein n=1 Tax=Olivibacter sitiensis TaxID=376470 RepID=UPI0004870E35|nr:hypothetical protein [Olivibacter sitiensis]
MEKEVQFDLNLEISKWMYRLKDEPSLTHSDSEELKAHLLDLMDELENLGLDEQERFWVASKRLGTISDWRSEFRMINKPIIQLRKVHLILTGVITYFITYYFSGAFSKLLCIVVSSLGERPANGLWWMEKSLVFILLIILIFTISIYYLDERYLSFVDRVKVRPKHALSILFLAILLAAADTCLNPLVKIALDKNEWLLVSYYNLTSYFDYCLPLLLCFCYAFLYFKKYNKSDTL